MVTERLPVGIKYPNWFDGLQVDRDDMIDEQTRNRNTDAANVHNFFSSGVVVNATSPNVILDTNSLSVVQQAMFDSDTFDGQSIYDNSDTVSDTIKGVLLSVTLSDVDLDGYAQTRVSVIGDTFGDSLVHDDFIFNQNGTQITRGRYKKIRSIIFSDFAGNARGSIGRAVDIDGYLTGRCLIVETDSLETSADTILASQTAQPNKFFGDFIPASWTITVTEMLDTAIMADDGAKSLADLDIGLFSSQHRELPKNDVSTQIGQKFQANGNNIQKISVLLSTKYDAVDGYDWSGSVVMSIYELQTEVNCPVSPVPDNAVDFDPDPRILGQLSLNKGDLVNQGVVLDGYSQIIDFVFTNTNISDPIRSPMTPGNYYMFTLHRSGDTSVGTLLIEESPQRAVTGYMVVYDGSQWINIKDSDTWYVVYGDYIKITDGVAYIDGVGVEVPKTYKDSTNTEAPYVAGPYEFGVVTRDAYNYVIMDRESEYSDPTQDQRTGNLISSRIKSIPNFSLISLSNLNTLLATNPAPLLLSCVRDRNPRANVSEVSGTTEMIGLARRNEFNILYPDADLIQHNWVGSLLIPDSVACCATYRIIKTEIINDAYGDINGDGIIDNDDIVALQVLRQQYLTYSGTNIIDLSSVPAQQFVADGYVDIEVLLRADVDGDGIVGNIDEGLIEQYVDKIISGFPAGSTFPRMQLTLENLIDPFTGVNIPNTCPSFAVVPFVDVDWKIEYFATWIPDLVIAHDSRRKLATTITDPVSGCDGGQNNFFVPGDLLLGGEILNPDNTGFRVDFEMTHLSLHIPITDAYGVPVIIDGYTGILLFDTFVAEESNGKTTSGFNAMKYSDNSYVQPADFGDGKIKIVPSIQSTSSQFVSIPFVSVSDILGINYDISTSLMTLYLADGYEVLAKPEIRTKILVEVFLKKAGFRNPEQDITDSEMRALLGIT